MSKFSLRNFKLSFLIVTLGIFQKALPNQLADSANAYITEFKHISQQQGVKLWGIKVIAPIMFIDTAADLIYLSDSVSDASITSYKNIWIYKFDTAFKFTNPRTDWMNKNWIVVNFPNNYTHQELIEFIAHESFHSVQNKLKIEGTLPGLAHLTSTQGKILMQAEISELLKALKADSKDLLRSHIKNALILRKYRYQLYPEGYKIEGQAELNEGLAEYSGIIYAGYTDDQLIKSYEKSIHLLQRMQSEMGYPYLAGSMYALLNDLNGNEWRNKIPEKYIHELTETIYEIEFNGDITTKANNILQTQEYQDLSQSIKSISTKSLTEMFSDSVLSLEIKGASFQFKSNLVVSLPERGTVYNNITITNSWGVLKVGEEGRALISTNDGKVMLNANSFVRNGSVINGENWTLTLNESWQVREEERYFVVYKADE